MKTWNDVVGNGERIVAMVASAGCVLVATETKIYRIWNEGEEQRLCEAFFKVKE